MRINTNMAALNAWRALTVNNENMTKSLEKLSSGYRVNRAADDAAGLAVSEKMRAQIRGLNMAVRNAQDGISLIQTAEGGASQIQAMVQRMRELAVQASNGTLTAEDRSQLQKEFKELQDEVTRTAQTTTFNNLQLLTREPVHTATVDAALENAGISAEVVYDAEYVPASVSVTFSKADSKITLTWKDADDQDQTTSITVVTGQTEYEVEELGLKVTFGSGLPANDVTGTVTIAEKANIGPNDGPIVLHVGPNDADTITVNVQKLDAATLKIDMSDINIESADEARKAIKALDEALETINGARARLGAYQNRLENAIGTLRIQSENLTAAESRIRDVDMAQEMANFTKYQILQQASTAMLAQANMSTQSILSLLR